MNNAKIFDYLNQLNGQSICAIGRTANMIWIGIGEAGNDVENRTDDAAKSLFSLHIQSAWRIINKEKTEIILASSDMYSPSKKMESEKAFEWDVQGNNLFDEKAPIWLEKESTLYIKEYKLNRWGDLLLVLSNRDCIEIFVDSSDYTESWRFFKCHSNEEHLVVTGLGFEFV